MGENALLELRGICKSFPGVCALNNVDFTLARGEIHALLGQNGAGKSTLIKVLTGVCRRDAGVILLDGQPIHPRSPRHAEELGIRTVYQEIGLVPHLSVAENLLLGHQPGNRLWINWKQTHRRAAQLLREIDLDIDVRLPLAHFPVAVQQMIAISRALYTPADGQLSRRPTRVLVLDEPTSSLAPAEVERLFAILRRLRDRGLGIIFISHFVEQVYAISDRITVLRNGQRVVTAPAASLGRVELLAHMLGHELASVQAVEPTARGASADAQAGPVLVRARGLGRRGALAPTNLEIRRGEVVGLAGLLGSGRTELARLLFGIDRADTGSLEIDGQPVRLGSPRQAIARGLGLCPEDRQAEGMIPNLSVRENVVLALQARRGWWRRLPGRRQRELAARFIDALRIANVDPDKRASELSGGNQQKILLARWLAADPRLLILDEPTRGIDVGAKAEIERLIQQLCRQGLAVLFTSCALEEVARNAHRVLVLRERRKVGELTGPQVSLSAILHLIATGVECD